MFLIFDWTFSLILITITRYIDTTQNWTLIMEQRRMIRFLRIMLNNSLNYIYLFERANILHGKNGSKGDLNELILAISAVPHTCTLCICSKIMLEANPLYQLSHAWQATIIISSPCSIVLLFGTVKKTFTFWNFRWTCVFWRGLT